MEYAKSTLKEFAKLIKKILRSDRDVTIGVGGFTGEGKSTFSTKLAKEYCKESNIPFSFNCMTWDREELITWANGEEGSERDSETGLRKGQLPEYSVIIPDELFKMFYRRTWFQEGQINAVTTFNTFRDRHLLVIGNIPDFWDLDGGFTKRIRFYVYIFERGRAWVFQQENNPFNTDCWNRNQNKKTFRKTKNPYRIPNFLFEIEFDDWNDEEKEEYLKIRNEKRLVMTEKEPKREGSKKTRFNKYKYALIECCKILIDEHNYNQTSLHKRIGISAELIGKLIA